MTTPNDSGAGVVGCILGSEGHPDVVDQESNPLVSWYRCCWCRISCFTGRMPGV